MATAAEHSEIVLSGILPNRKDLLDKAMRMLTPEHFPDKLHARLFQVLSAYNDRVNSVIPRKNLDDFFRGKIDESQLILMLEAYDAFCEMQTEEPEFHWSIDQLREIDADNKTGQAIAEAMDLLKNEGNIVAREKLLESISVIDRELVQVQAPEGLVQDESTDILEEYAEAKAKRAEGKVQGIGFGVESLDRVTGGMQRGDLVMVAASSSNGKSSLAAQSAWYAATQQGANAVFFATETSRNQIRRKIVARHSKLEMFGYPQGLDMRSLKDGTLTDREEKVLLTVVKDLKENPNYGKLHIAQVPRGSTILSLEQKLNRICREYRVDHAVMDYLALLQGTSSYSEERSKYVEILREAKLVAGSVADGLGISFMSPWQINREGRKLADQTGYYTMDNLADTAEANRIADLIISMYRSADQTGRFAELTFQILKARDGELQNDMVVEADYGTCTFTSKAGLVMSRAVTERDYGSTGSLDGLYD